MRNATFLVRHLLCSSINITLKHKKILHAFYIKHIGIVKICFSESSLHLSVDEVNYHVLNKIQEVT